MPVVRCAGPLDLFVTHPTIMAPDLLDARVRAFEGAVAEHFADLQSVHGFTRGDPRVRDAEEPRDAAVSIRYSRADLRIDLGMALYHDLCGLVIRDPNWYRRPKPRIKAITLDDLTRRMGLGSARRARPRRGLTEMGVDAEVARLARRFSEVKELVLEQGGAFFTRLPTGRDRQ